MDTKQAITEKQGLVDEMELQLMSSAPESIPCVVELRDELNVLYDDVTIHFCCNFSFSLKFSAF